MLTKLLKYELKATARVMVPLYALAVALCAVTNITLLEWVVKTDSDPNLVNIVLLAASSALIGAVLAATVVLMVQRFRSNLLGDEGHVMFTLPVSIHQHIWAKTLVAVFWVLTTLFVAFECTLILGYNGALWMPFPWFREALTAFMDRITSVDATIPELPLGAALPISAAAIIISAVGLGLEIFAALALGHSFHKHKVLLSVVFFLGIQGIYHLIGGTLPLLADLIFYFFPSQSPTGVYMLDMGGSMVFSLLWAAVLYAITHYTLKHRLNLE